MAEISPFPGIRFDEERVGDLACVICPPYDVISPEEQRAYYEKSEYNVVRLEHGLQEPADTETDNKHLRAKAAFSRWLNAGVLSNDPVPAFYVHEHGFSYENMRRRRLGLVACVRLEPWEKGIVVPHENTVSGIKSDRLELMRACSANFSPLLGLYEDPGQRLGKLLMSQTKRRPLIDFSDGDERHRLWMCSEPEFVQRVSHFLASKPIYMADGHHRYETALAYRDERQQHTSSVRGNEAFNFVLMTLVAFSDPGLLALPLHRLVTDVTSETVARVRGQLEAFFEVETFFPGEVASPQVIGATALVLGLQPGSVTALKVRQSASLREAMPDGHSEAYSKLDVSIVEHVIMGQLLLPHERFKMAYTPDAEQAALSVEREEYQLAFLLNPVPVATIKAIADAHDRMPGKSTYFYPKLPTGLVINGLEGRL